MFCLFTAACEFIHYFPNIINKFQANIPGFIPKNNF